MNTVSRHAGRASQSGTVAEPRGAWRPDASLRKILFGCGIVSSVLYVTADIVASLLYTGYSYVDHTYSELLAVGSPVRLLMIALSAIPYAVLMTTFAIGVGSSAGRKRAARITAALLVGYAVTGLVTGLLFPMNTREALAAGEAGLRNAMHPVGTGVMSLFLLLAMGFGATLLDRRFRVYTYITIVTLLLFGILTSLQAGRMTADLPTPWMGLEERINIYATMLWLAILGVRLQRAGDERSSGAGRSGMPSPPAIDPIGHEKELSQ